MTIEFDPDKDVVNKTKHGVSLSMASDLDWEVAQNRVRLEIGSEIGNSEIEIEIGSGLK